MDNVNLSNLTHSIDGTKLNSAARNVYFELKKDSLFKNIGYNDVFDSLERSDANKDGLTDAKEFDNAYALLREKATSAENNKPTVTVKPALQPYYREWTEEQTYSCVDTSDVNLRLPEKYSVTKNENGVATMTDNSGLPKGYKITDENGVASMSNVSGLPAKYKEYVDENGVASMRDSSGLPKGYSIKTDENGVSTMTNNRGLPKGYSITNNNGVATMTNNPDPGKKGIKAYRGKDGTLTITNNPGDGGLSVRKGANGEVIYTIYGNSK